MESSLKAVIYVIFENFKVLAENLQAFQSKNVKVSINQNASKISLSFGKNFFFVGLPLIVYTKTMGNLKNDIPKTFIIRDMPILLQSLIYYKFTIPFLTSFKMCMDGF